jgi:hypothetical protein
VHASLPSFGFVGGRPGAGGVAPYGGDRVTPTGRPYRA